MQPKNFPMSSIKSDIWSVADRYIIWHGYVWGHFKRDAKSSLLCEAWAGFQDNTAGILKGYSNNAMESSMYTDKNILDKSY